MATQPTRTPDDAVPVRGRRRSSTRRRAADGAGSVVARPLAGGRLAYDVYWTYTDDRGQRRRGSAKGFRSAKEAEKHRRAVTTTVDTGRYLPPQDMTLGEYLVEWLDGLRLKPQTIAGYRRKIRLQVIPHLGQMRLDQVRAIHLNKLYRQLEIHGGASGGRCRCPPCGRCTTSSPRPTATPSRPTC